jgi:hypothetical protein
MTAKTPKVSSDNSIQISGLLEQSSADFLLYGLATVMMRYAGHRYGTFLDSASTAAKLTIYSTYLEKNRSFRKTANLYHVESKRIKAIVQEIEALLLSSESLTILGSEEPSYLIDLPYLWIEQYPWSPGQSRIPVQSLTETERQQLLSKLPESMPPARLIRDIELDELLRTLYEKATAKISVARFSQCSDPLLEHLKCRLLDAGTIIRLDSTILTNSLYALVQMSYSPKGRSEKISHLVQDVARLFKLLLLWLDERPNVLRAVETLEISPDQEHEALAEMDAFLRSWADKYHQPGGTPMVLQAAVGPDDDPYFTKS